MAAFIPGSGTMANFRAELARRGFAAFLAGFPPNLISTSDWAAKLAVLDPELRVLASFFLFGEPIRPDALPPPIAEALPVLTEYGIVAAEGSELRLVDIALFRPHGIWLFAEPPTPFLARHYFGADSLALAMHATPEPGASCLDLCAGTGFQGLVAAARCHTSTLVELVPQTARLAELNVLLNGFHDRVEVLCGDLYEPLGNRARYDLVVANVPFLPMPERIPLPASCAGGPDGFAVGRRVLAGLPDHLAPGGTAHLSALLLYAGDDLLLREELAAWADQHDCGMLITPITRQPVSADSDLVQATVSDIEEASGIECTAEVTALYRDRGVTSASLAFLRIDQGGKGVRILDLRPSRPSPAIPWVRPEVD